MLHTNETYPFWKTTLEEVNQSIDTAIKGEAHILCKTAGGRTVRYLTYGAPVDYERQANYSSACGARNPAYYAKREGKRPTILLIGATHGQENEGVAGLMNLISLLETGRDLRGLAVPELLQAYEASDCRLIILPVYNADGRARCVPDSMIGEKPEELRYHGQGTWKDGSLCGWPACKAIHPIKESAGHLGAYFNDDGINLMHDNFFVPMAEETRALLAMCDKEAPECVIGLHGGSNTTNILLQPDFVPLETKEAVHRLAEATAAYQTALGLKSAMEPISEHIGSPEPSFNLTSALHHVSGAVSSTYESNEGLIADNAFTAEEILLHHYCLFRALLDCAWRA